MSASPESQMNLGGPGPDFGTWEDTPSTSTQTQVERQTMEVDIACAGFGPATGGFLTTLVRAWNQNPADPAFESRVAPGMPLQVLCYERADDIAAGVSGVVTRAQGIRASFPDLDPAEIPMATNVGQERVIYLLDPIGASRRSFALRAADVALRIAGPLVGVKHHAFKLPWTPAFLNKHGGLVLSIGQFNQWVGSQLMAGGLVQIWPGTPVSAPIFSEESADPEKQHTEEPGLGSDPSPVSGHDFSRADQPSGLSGALAPAPSSSRVDPDKQPHSAKSRAVLGLRLADQGVEKSGAPTGGFMAGMDVRAQLTVIGDGPVGAIGQALDRQLGLPPGHAHREWALGMKFVIELPEDSTIEPGTVWHTFGYPEPEIFGFLYVHPERLVSVGIFVPSWMGDPSRTAYRYLQHYIQHPAIWPWLKDGTLRSWGAKSLEESGKHGEPFLSGDGFARIGEGSGSTNMLTGSGVDEAWTTGVQLAEAVVELLRAGKPFTSENLDATYEARRRASWVERGAWEAQNARTGFHSGVVSGMIGMALSGLTRGKIALGGHIPPAHKQIARAQSGLKLKDATELAIEDGRPLHDALLTARGWPEIPFDGRLLVTHQDALLLGGKVQAIPGFADHVLFRDAALCIHCDEKTCIAMCSGQAITAGPNGLPAFEREKCVHCGACLWNCSQSTGGDQANIEFHAGAGGLHSAEN